MNITKEQNEILEDLSMSTNPKVSYETNKFINNLFQVTREQQLLQKPIQTIGSKTRISLKHKKSTYKEPENLPIKRMQLWKYVNNVLSPNIPHQV